MWGVMRMCIRLGRRATLRRHKIFNARPLWLSYPIQMLAALKYTSTDGDSNCVLREQGNRSGVSSSNRIVSDSQRVVR